MIVSNVKKKTILVTVSVSNLKEKIVNNRSENTY